jgi:hypothetical protein
VFGVAVAPSIVDVPTACGVDVLCDCVRCSGVQEQHALAESLANSRESELKELKVG